MAFTDPTYIGQIASVTGGVIRVRLRQDMPTTLVLVDGESYRVGQIGGFFGFHWGTGSSMRSAIRSAPMQLRKHMARSNLTQTISGRCPAFDG